MVEIHRSRWFSMSRNEVLFRLFLYLQGSALAFRMHHWGRHEDCYEHEQDGKNWTPGKFYRGIGNRVCARGRTPSAPAIFDPGRSRSERRGTASSSIQ